MAFHFARPAGFAHAAGQNVLVTLLAPSQTDSQGDSRTFTLASAPHEPDLMVATRMRDSDDRARAAGTISARREGAGLLLRGAARHDHGHAVDAGGHGRLRKRHALRGVLRLLISDKDPGARASAG